MVGPSIGPAQLKLCVSTPDAGGGGGGGGGGWGHASCSEITPQPLWVQNLNHTQSVFFFWKTTQEYMYDCSNLVPTKT